MSGRCDGTVPLAVKVVVSGGLGVGKTTFIGAISETEPLDTQAAITHVSVGVDTPDGAESRTTRTVALDFGRITLDPTIALYLFGAPESDAPGSVVSGSGAREQGRISFMWEELSEGALGTVILADTRRIEDCFPAVDYFEDRGVPFVLAVNRFEGAERLEPEEVRRVLGLRGEVPVLECDARERDSVRDVLGALMDRVLGIRVAPAERAAEKGKDAARGRVRV
ncbi:ATP/GTP-binding protein [Streptomyces spinosirectus]|jgi:signal recognition particle receptor subunit beta|uniref:GTP-binding protein n=1 Tax=Streptomyces TaxID=1883 RepID=UPI001C9DAA7E|nr:MULTISPECIES: ATP/GTP-binding protein [Streptomyces]MBY8343906.1 ATP/GTP-binding protein [Streptomyces plumbidurans]UIR17149.1 ATP/GTP-binding protein [Streptomyces spinosirectus]